MTNIEIKKIRSAAGLSQDKFAELLGCSPRAVKHWEKGTHAPMQIFIDKLKELNKEKK